MVAANELRIGNWVMAGSASYQIKSICNDDRDECGVGNQWTYDGLYYDYSFDEISPIPLTPEILEKCGFVYDRMDKEYDIVDDFYIDKQFNVYYKVWEGSDDRGGLEPRVFRTIQSLHQLQNLYFALTGEELAVKL